MNQASNKSFFYSFIIASLGSFIILCATYQPSIVPLQRQSIALPTSQGLTSFLKWPLIFEANQGQTNNEVRYLTKGNGYHIYFTPREVVMDLRVDNTEHAVLRLQFTGANPKPTLSGLNKLPSKSNYFIGNDPKNWHTNINHFAKVMYENLYPGIDAIFYGHHMSLEYDIRVAKNTDPSLVQFQISGAKKLRIDIGGNLIVEIGNNKSLTVHKPFAYQIQRGNKQAIPAHFTLVDHHTIGFLIGQYDKSQPLIIDPAISYATYLGGTGGAEGGHAIAVDSNGDAYIAGDTNSLDFPSLNPYQSKNKSKQRSIFVTKLSSDGQSLIYSTYLGGTGGRDEAFAIAIDKSGNAYVTGDTNSKDFPTKNAFQALNKGPDLTAYVTKLNASGNGLIYSTYLGGSGGNEEGNGIAVDGNGFAHVTGETDSKDFPITANAFQKTHKGPVFTAYITKFNPAGDGLVYSTFLGGSGGNDEGNAIALDRDGCAYITGATNSKDFPILNPFQATPKAKGASLTAFVSRLNSEGNALVYSTYLGGSGGHDEGFGIAVDEDKNAYITGETNSNDFPTHHPIQAINKGPNFTAFVTKLNSSGNALKYSTYLGGTGGDEKGLSIALDPENHAYVTGYTNSTDFPTVNAIQTNNAGPGRTVFLTKFSHDAIFFHYSTYLGGGGGNDQGFAVAVNGWGDAFITGLTNSANFPLHNPYQSLKKGTITAFVAKIRNF